MAGGTWPGRLPRGGDQYTTMTTGIYPDVTEIYTRF
jgi:hypothetical protein